MKHTHCDICDSIIKGGSKSLGTRSFEGKMRMQVVFEPLAEDICPTCLKSVETHLDTMRYEREDKF